MKKYFEESEVTTCHSDERNLLSVAYKNVVGSRRSAWRVLKSIRGREDNDEKNKMTDDYIKTVEKELNDICKEVIVSDAASDHFHCLNNQPPRAPINILSFLRHRIC